MINDATTLAVLGLMITIIGSVWSLSMWLSKQFSTLKNLVYSEAKHLRETFIDKLEDHEKHDDKRFEAVTSVLWNLRVENAARDAAMSHSRYHSSDKETQWLKNSKRQSSSMVKETQSD